jgi:phage shock protein C
MDFKQTLNHLHRCKTDAWVGGVCAGIGETTETPAWVWRAGFLFTVSFLGTGILLYLILWLVMPESDRSR